MINRKIALLSATGVAGLLVSLPTTAWAQDSATAQQAPTSAATDAAKKPAVSADGIVLDDPAASEETKDITVTGSRIRLPNLQGLEPTVRINQEYLSDRGLTNVADALNEIPGIRGSVTPNGAQGSFGQGVNFINTFNLGSNRTLTLVNGRRYVSSNVTTIFNQGSAGTQVDVNVIPTLLVDHIDQVSVGGAPTYGSDAIAGTINYVLNTRLNGVKLSATTGITEQGDQFRYNFAAAVGHDFLDGRANITLAYNRDRTDGVLFNSRSYLRANISNLTNPCVGPVGANCPAGNLLANQNRAAGITFTNDGRLNTSIPFNESQTDGIPPSIQVRDVTIPFLTYGGLITAASANLAGTGSVAAAVRNYAFDASGNLVPFNRGIEFPGQRSSGGDGFRFNDFSQITSNVQRDVFNAFGTFDILDNVTMFAEGTYFHSRGDELVQQPTFNSSLFGGSSGPLTFTATSPFLTPQARAQLATLGVQRFQVSRASIDLADLTGYSTNDLYRLVLGERGKFSIGERDFNWEVSANYGRVNIADNGQDLNAQNFANAVNVTTNGSGQIVCTATPTVQAAPGFTARADPSCVPLNLLGAGLSDPAARAYVISQNLTKSYLEQEVINANIGGSPFDLFGNKVGFNVGYEHRQEKGGFTPSSFQQLGLGRSVAIAPVSGRYNTDEAFGEIVVPVVSPTNDLWFLNSLELYGRGRYVDNSVNGGFFSYAYGGRIAPIKDIAFRGNYTKSFRAPAITELFSPQSNVFTTVPDLCSPGNRGAGAVPATRTANCQAFLAAFPNATPLDAASATVPGRNGGNPNLDNEVAESFTYGVVLQPRFVPGLTVSVDYININISKPIASLTVATIAGACFDNANFNTADPANGNAFCSQIRRYTAADGGVSANGGSRAGQVISDPANPGVTSGFVNGNRIKFDGLQAQLDYYRPLSGLNIPGRAGIDGTLFFVRTRISDITGVAPVRTDGTLGDPTWQGQLNARYVGEGFGLVLQANYTGEQLFSRVSRGIDLREVDKFDAYWTFNPNIYFDVEGKYRFNFAVTNLTNRVGQNFYGYINSGSYNDQLGRRFTMTVSLKL